MWRVWCAKRRRGGGAKSWGDGGGAHWGKVGNGRGDPSADWVFQPPANNVPSVVTSKYPKSSLTRPHLPKPPPPPPPTPSGGRGGGCPPGLAHPPPKPTAQEPFKQRLVIDVPPTVSEASRAHRFLIACRTPPASTNPCVLIIGAKLRERIHQICRWPFSARPERKVSLRTSYIPPKIYDQ